MALISKESFEKLTEEEKFIIRRDYNTLQVGLSTGLLEDVSLVEQKAKIKEFESIFGKEALQPEPKIKTWKDMKEEYMLRADAGTSYIIDMDKKFYSEKLALKSLATLQIAKLIEIGYGGMITDEEWKNVEFKKYGIICRPYNKELFIKDIWNEQCFISFHTKQQAEEFMSYPENVKLVEQYYMI